MAQLPPKIPCSMMTCSLNWPAAAAAAATTSAAALQPSWVDEFLDFSAAKRGAHRRSVSDSGPFLEAGPAAPAAEFDRLDDDQLMSIGGAGADHGPQESQKVSEPNGRITPQSNRQSAQRSRVRKLQYIAELERSVTTLQTEVSALSPEWRSSITSGRSSASVTAISSSGSRPWHRTKYSRKPTKRH
uniref:BZIP domain-containing protein n=1 Tax=Ananas comosus var. bracteatus TaxID=296719 RepID=A0A6V7PU44_ANACO|nr:unnamed protein product [Ananas comosus var. bracteatus]